MKIIDDPANRFPDLLRDESQRIGRADALALPEDAEAVAEALRLAAARGWTVTTQGARTGIAGGAVPDGGMILSLARMDRLLGARFDRDGTPLLRVQPGLTLTALRRWLSSPVVPPAPAGGWTPAERAAWTDCARRRWRFPPDPTETTASVGGMVACNASGACSFRYGATRRWIESLRVTLADGDTLELRRGGDRAMARHFELCTRSGRRLAGELPGYRMPAVKHAAGYWVRDDMDLTDLFIGSEGTLGVVTEVELRLAPSPGAIWGINAFMPDEASALDLLDMVRAQAGPERDRLGAPLTAIEYLDGGALRLLRAAEAGGGGCPVPPPEAGCAIYFEFERD
ncbi:MAG: FAD-binding oxidoreductase, partial [Kiritimatiellae bacterium]|nr:FAD-binding oxidoreductase [Kiritimatiellia bacterium]